MTEYIERSAVLQNKTTMTEYDEGGWDAPVSVVRVEDIEAIPAADVAPVVHGRWEYDHWCEFKCSVCGAWSKSEPYRGKENYCPNCGAKMDGDKL